MTWATSLRAWLILGTLVIGVYSWEAFLARQYAWPVVALWLGGTCAFLALVAEPPAWHITRVPRIEWTLFAAVMIAGVALRLYHLSDIPYGLNNDAAYSGLVAIKIAHSTTYIPWSPDPTQGETFFDYWIVAMFALVGPVPLAIKGAAAAVGILTLVGMYLFTRRLLDLPSAVIATALLATSGWHVIFSRVGWRVITQPLVEVFALYFLVRAFSTRQRGSFALAGALLALQIDTYPAARIVPALASVWALIELTRGPDRMALIRGYVLAAVAFLLAGASVLAFTHTNPGDFAARYNSVSIMSAVESGNWQPLWHNIQLTTGIYTVHANGNDFFLEQPLLDPPTRWLFVLGLGIAVGMLFPRRVDYPLVLLAVALLQLPGFITLHPAYDQPDRLLLIVGLVIGVERVLQPSRRYVYVLLGLGFLLLPGLTASPNGNRATGTMPFVFILAALPLVAGIQIPATSLQRFSASMRTAFQSRPGWAMVGGLTRWLPHAAVGLVLLSSLEGTFDQYLGPNRTPLWGFASQASVIGDYINRLDGRYDAYIFGDYGEGSLAYVTYRAGDPAIDLLGNLAGRHYQIVDNLQVSKPADLLAIAAKPGKGVVVFMPPYFTRSDPVVITLLRRSPGSLAFLLTHRDGLVGGPVSFVVLVPPHGERINPALLVGT